MQTTGQVIFRDKGAAPTNDGRKLVMIIGIIAVSPKWAYKSEYQYTVFGREGSNTLLVFPESEINRTEDIKGNTTGGILQSPIWRC
jgi:hypothetical protein